MPSTVPIDPDPPPLEDLVASGQRHLEELGYSERTCQHYSGLWRALLRFARNASAPQLTWRVATAFLESRGIARGKARFGVLTSSQERLDERSEFSSSFKPAARSVVIRSESLTRRFRSPSGEICTATKRSVGGTCTIARRLSRRGGGL
jgi:hypothetical protein